MRTTDMPSIDLPNNSVVILGGTGALGRRIASELAERGAALTIVGRDPVEAQQVAASVGGVAASADLLDPSTLGAPLATALDAHGSVSGIVNAAGVVAFGPLAGMEPDVIDQVVTVNLTSPLAIYAEALPHMSGGFIANLSGIVATIPTAGMAAYSASKAGLSAATIALARETRRDGITVIDARLPHTESGLVDRALVGEPPRLPVGLDPDAAARRLVEGIAVGKRVLEPEWFTQAGT